MAFADTPDSVINSIALNRLDNLDVDEYIIALGPDSRQFLGTPNGYSATHLPAQVLREVSAGRVKKIVWASYGSRPGSWFFTCELRDGASAFQVGPDIPPALSTFIRQLDGSHLLLSSLRVQLGDNDSFVVWSRTVWACANVPRQLQAKLCEGSSGSREANGITKGSLRSGTLDNVQWHANGSFYIKSGDRHLWRFTVKLVHSAWNKASLWKEQARDHRVRRINDELAYVAISPYAQNGETFAFIKKQSAEQEAPFIIHFEQETLQTNLANSTEPAVPNRTSPARTSDSEPSHATRSSIGSSFLGERMDGSDERMQHMPKKPEEEEEPFIWATCKKTGRPHNMDHWELELKKCEKVKVTREMGRDWWLVTDRRGIEGWVHASWLDFKNRRPHADAKEAYKHFKEDLDKVLVPGQLSAFPTMAGYVEACTKPQCQQLKQDAAQLGICVHDLAVLLEGSGSLSHDWLKAERNVWHPDRFARFCHPEHTDRLKVLAEQMFVMYGVIMANLERHGVTT